MSRTTVGRRLKEAEERLGVTFLACFDGDADPGLVRVGARLSDEARALWVLTLPELRNNSRIRAFMDHVYDAFQPHQRALEGALTPAP